MNEPHSGATNGNGTGAAGLGDRAARPDAEGAAPDDAGRATRSDVEPSPAREMSLHLLRMLETRMEAAGIALQGETQLVLARLQLKLFAAAAVFIAIWGGIVLLAIALPPDLRVPVLAAVVAAFVVVAIAAQWFARKKASTQQVGSLHWFLDGLRQDLEVVSRTLARNHEARQPGPTPSQTKSAPHDFAA
ncbi:MAG TPA: hypothetical protein VM146_17915 [Steroidobacteraceae bacterium]|nr:hypothetical protein [Steroidobacteraceae bacterium]